MAKWYLQLFLSQFYPLKRFSDPLGRKRAMLIVNVPMIIGWFLLYNSSSVVEIFIGNSFIGLGIGLMESPILTYIGEITEPSVRGVLMAYSALSGTFGMFIVMTLNTLMAWRTVALVCMFVPILAILLLMLVRIFGVECWINSQFQFHFKFVAGAGNADVVAIQKSSRWCGAIASVAARLGAEIIRSTRTPTIRTVQWAFEIMWRLYQTKSTVFSSGADYWH